MPAARRGFTLIELLVVLVIIGLLVAVLIPTVQHAREEARLSQCRNNLKLLGLAIHNYHDTFSVFPPGYIGEQWADKGEGHWTWALSIAPYMESAPMYNELQMGEKRVHEVLQDHQVSHWLTTTTFDSRRCPSDVGPLLNTGLTLDGRLPNRQIAGQSLLLTNYVAVNSSGSLQRDPPPLAQGMFFRNSAVKITDITDGTSNTVMLGERSWHLNGCAPQAGVLFALVNDEPGPDGLGVREGGGNRAADLSNTAQYDSGLAYCFAGGSAYLNERAPISRFGLSSVHSKGVPILCADGAVRLLSRDIHHNPDSALPNDSVYERLLSFSGGGNLDCAP